MVGVPIPGTHLGHPGFGVVSLNPTEFLFYSRIDQNPLDVGLLCCHSNKGDIGRTPIFAIDIFPISGNQVARGNIIAFFFAQYTIWHWHEPDIDVESDLMTFMSEWKRATARLRHISDQDAVPAGDFGGNWREPLQKIHEFGMSPIAIARD